MVAKVKGYCASSPKRMGSMKDLAERIQTVGQAIDFIMSKKT